MSFYILFKTSYKVYFKKILKTDAILINIEPAELQSTISTSENTSWQLKVSPIFIKHFCFKFL